MCYKTFAIFFIMVLLFSCDLVADPVSMPKMVNVKASVREAPPAWAVMERKLISTMEEAAPVYLERFTRRGGTLYGGGPWDDVYEMFYNWPLFYAIGADEELLNRGIQEYNALTRQCTYQEPQLYKEFPKSSDWFHISEGMMAFLDIAVGDPTIPENIDRAKRFAGFYMNEDPESSANFDPEYKVITSIGTGSKGPREKAGGAYALKYGHASLHPIVEDLEPDWDKDPKRREEIQNLYDDIVTPCDIPTNLSVTGLITNAYLYTGEEKYKKWVLDYIDTWIGYIKKNDGILPDNVGRTGKIGEYREGQWWGGLFGWTGRYSIQMIYGSLSVAAECGYMLSGDPDYLYLLRSQIDMLLENAITTKEGQLLVPYKYGPDGWHSYRPMMIRDMAHLWHASMNPEDWKRIEKVKKGSKFHPLPYKGIWSVNMLDIQDKKEYQMGELFDWNYVPPALDRIDDYPTEYARIAYYAGENPEWPLKVLQAEYEHCVNTLEFMRNEPRDIYSIRGDDLYPNNPVVTKGLTQVTLGAPQTIYNGGLLRARVRYFDIDRVRPGLPLDVAALVEGLEVDRTVVHLVNLSVMDTRRIIVQAGAFGEHSFTEVRFQEQSKDSSGKKVMNERSVPVNNKYFAVELPPATSIKLDIGTRRFVNKPSYAFPWH